MDSTRAATEAHGVVKVKAAKKRDEGSLCSLLSSAAAGATEGTGLCFIGIICPFIPSLFALATLLMPIPRLSIHQWVEEEGE